MGAKISTYCKEYYEKGGAPESHSNAVKRARKIKNRPIMKFYCWVHGACKPFRISNKSKSTLKEHQTLWSKRYPDNILTFSEIKPIKRRGKVKD